MSLLSLWKRDFPTFRHFNPCTALPLTLPLPTLFTPRVYHSLFSENIPCVFDRDTTENWQRLRLWESMRPSQRLAIDFFYWIPTIFQLFLRITWEQPQWTFKCVLATISRWTEVEKKWSIPTRENNKKSNENLSNWILKIQFQLFRWLLFFLLIH